jgi:hypothetical protein
MLVAIQHTGAPTSSLASEIAVATDRLHLLHQEIERSARCWPCSHIYLRTTVEALAAGHPQSRLDEFLPWFFMPSPA